MEHYGDSAILSHSHLTSIDQSMENAPRRDSSHPEKSPTPPPPQLIPDYPREDSTGETAEKLEPPTIEAVNLPKATGKDEIKEERLDETEEFMDEELDGMEADMKPFEQRAHHAITGRGVTLAMLMADGFIQPGNDTMSIDYLGQNFRADLLDGGRIRENGKVFGTPSAWAIHCKNIVNPGKKSGCGWASVKYKGKKLDAYKLSWLSKHRPLAIAAMAAEEVEDCESCEGDHTEVHEEKPKTSPPHPQPMQQDIKPEIKLRPLQPLRPSVRHSTLGKKSSHHDPKTLVECVPFVALAKIQPFTISVSPFCLLVMDVQCHLSSTEVVGYLGGEWDHNRQHLSIQRAYPCLCRQKDPSTANEVEETIRYQMSQHGVQLAGWYHSHPKMQPDPSLNDIESQMDYQLQLRGSNNTYHPCVGFIVSPFEPWSSSPVSRIRSYWVMPPPENRPTDYGTPMFMEFNESQDSLQMENLLSELKKIVEFYRSDSDLMPLTDIWYGHITIAEKLRDSLEKRFPASCKLSDVMTLISSLSERKTAILQ